MQLFIEIPTGLDVERDGHRTPWNTGCVLFCFQVDRQCSQSNGQTDAS
ncbi:hypothetical protein PUR31_03015 [Pseudomonas mosselii]|nr:MULTISPECIES: hypothetical protein [unclassified Pseudomonas]MCP8632111.1 hypothetical protein [Pseudomonas sp. DVZ6]MDC0687032.1 hypothetical protein [Mitsuaria sp. RG]MDD7783059.1 hypothetical protein [Pseudomonas sp. DVZ24]